MATSPSGPASRKTNSACARFTSWNSSTNSQRHVSGSTEDDMGLAEHTQAEGEQILELPRVRARQLSL
jgi:hypothetical protein